jgi:hypothetical protein
LQKPICFVRTRRFTTCPPRPTNTSVSSLVWQKSLLWLAMCVCTGSTRSVVQLWCVCVPHVQLWCVCVPHVQLWCVCVPHVQLWCVCVPHVVQLLSHVVRFPTVTKWMTTRGWPGKYSPSTRLYPDPYKYWLLLCCTWILTTVLSPFAHGTDHQAKQQRKWLACIRMKPS